MKTKKYTCRIVYIEHKDGMKEMRTYVNRRKSPLPPQLKNWIAKDYIDRLFMKENL